MMIPRIDLTLYQGATFTQILFWRYRKDGENVPVDLAGCAVRMHIRRRLNSRDIELDLGDADMIRIDDPDEGRIVIDIPAETTASLTFRSAVYDIEVVFPDGHVYRLAEGAVRLDPEVTRQS